MPRKKKNRNKLSFSVNLKPLFSFNTLVVIAFLISAANQVTLKKELTVTNEDVKAVKRYATKIDSVIHNLINSVQYSFGQAYEDMTALKNRINKIEKGKK